MMRASFLKGLPTSMWNWPATVQTAAGPATRAASRAARSPAGTFGAEGSPQSHGTTHSGTEAGPERRWGATAPQGLFS